MDPLTLLGLGIGTGSDLIGMGMEAYDNKENRKLSRRGLAQQEKNSKFQRLMSLMQQSQGTQQGMAGAQRLMSLRNAGGV